MQENTLECRIFQHESVTTDRCIIKSDRVFSLSAYVCQVRPEKSSARNFVLKSKIEKVKFKKDLKNTMTRF